MNSKRFLAAAICVALAACQPQENRPPEVSDLDVKATQGVPYIEQRVQGSDPDRDAITFELVSPSSGAGYDDAILIPLSGALYVTLTEGFEGFIQLQFRATDGHLFSNTGFVTIEVSDTPASARGLGAETVDPALYAAFDSVNLEIAPVETFGAASSIDLSPSFPIPGNQEQLGSCVGWATAYALKSYHEQVEIGWELDRTSRVFSPTYVFNQIAISGCQGSQIYDALELIVQQGCATLSTVPYNSHSCTQQPSSQAKAEAQNYRAQSWSRVNTLQQVKNSLESRNPVVLGIRIYGSFYSLSGPNSVYNSTAGGQQGLHAVTITGYNDSLYGGAFRVINSWGTQWGDGGYFWLPYSFFNVAVDQMYTLVDRANSNDPDPDEDVDPQPSGDPNLVVGFWNTNYDARPGGTGVLRYEIQNSGAGTVPSGAEVALLLSRDQTFTTSDTYLLKEQIPFSMPPGTSAYRNESNSITYSFPTSVGSGIYYLAMVVDAPNAVRESNEGDNVAIGSGTLQFAGGGGGGIADLNVDFWQANWDGFGNGVLQYTIRNIGSAPVNTSNWQIGLVLSPDLIVNNGNDYYLFIENGLAIPPNNTVYRDGLNPGYFRLGYQYNGAFVAPGVYYMAFVADAQGRIVESNEQNNVSFGANTVFIPGFKQTDPSETPEFEPGQLYNGRVLPNADGMVTKVRVVHEPDGSVNLEVLEQVKVGPDADPNTKGIFQKENHSADVRVFPIVDPKSMPN